MSLFVRRVFVVILLGDAVILSSAPGVAQESVIEQGKAIALERSKGNCMVCHQIPGLDFYGDIAPPLVAMQARFPDKQKLRAQIYDATQFNPNSVMPPFGRHDILTPQEIDKVVEWLYTL